jgi:hypothetical protein
MAVLQAARAQKLGLSRDSAYSWGLNRAIFYAAAKQGFRGGGQKPGESTSRPSGGSSTPERYRLGDEEALREPSEKELRFTIGDKTQTPADFERQISSRFVTKENFRAAWEEAERIVDGFDRETLESRRQFFDTVYRPRRDELSQAWTRAYAKVSEPV